MALLVTQRIDNGDGTEMVYVRTPAGNYAHIHIGHNLYGSELMWRMLELAATKQDSKAAALDQLSASINHHERGDENEGM